MQFSVKQFILLLLSIICSYYAFSQQNAIGIKSGVMFSSFIDNYTANGYRKSIPLGITFETKISNFFLFGTGISYSPRGMHYDGTRIYPGDTSTYEQIIHHDYVEVPLKLGFHVGNKLSTTAWVGVVPAWFAKYYSKVSYRNTISRSTRTIKGDQSRFDLSGTVEYEICYEITNKNIVGISGAYLSSFTQFSAERIQMHSFSILLGLKRSF